MIDQDWFGDYKWGEQKVGHNWSAFGFMPHDELVMNLTMTFWGFKFIFSLCWFFILKIWQCNHLSQTGVWACAGVRFTVCRCACRVGYPAAEPSAAGGYPHRCTDAQQSLHHRFHQPHGAQPSRQPFLLQEGRIASLESVEFNQHFMFFI